MRKLSSLKSFGFLSILMGAFVVVGINYLESKESLKWDWIVEIPNLAEAQNEGLNLYGYDNRIYERNDFVAVDVRRQEDGETGEIYYAFLLKIDNTEKDKSNSYGYYWIGFRNLAFAWCINYYDMGGEGPCRCCVFPNSQYSKGISCSELRCGGFGGTGYKCIENFLTSHKHPSWGYDHVSITMHIYCDIEAIPTPGSVITECYMRRLNIWNTAETLEKGYEDYHNIECHYVFPLEDVEVIRSEDGNTWTVIVDQDGGPSKREDMIGKYKLLAFRESYFQGIKKTSGKSGREFISSEYHGALGGRTIFRFKSIWTRFEEKNK